jgi:biopolymer transport protein ExbD
VAFHLPGSKSTPTTLAEINVTPFVDVMLVLLIIFMVSAPLMKQGAQIDLPKANTGTLDQAPDQIFLSVSGVSSLPTVFPAKTAIVEAGSQTAHAGCIE